MTKLVLYITGYGSVSGFYLIFQFLKTLKMDFFNYKFCDFLDILCDTYFMNKNLFATKLLICFKF